MNRWRHQNTTFLFSVSLCLCGSNLFAADVKKPAKITYEQHVLPLFREKCVACHNQDKKKAGLVLDNYTKVIEGSSSGVVVKPGDADGSACIARWPTRTSRSCRPSRRCCPRRASTSSRMDRRGD